MFLLNKNIVCLIDDIFWNMEFKHETQTEKVILIMFIICIIHVMTIIVIILIILIIYCFVLTLVLRITFDRISEMSLPYQWITWVISFVLQCAPDG
jgi:hypothetical protein